MQRRTLLLAGLSAGLALPAHARIAQLGDAIDKAGAQRMLSQRMGKAWLGQLQPELAPRARQVLDDSAARFEQQLRELLAFAPTPEIAGSYKALLSRFGDYRALLLSRPDREQVNELLKRSGEVLSIAHVATTQLQERSSAATARLVNLSGRQRMLSQRLALYFLARQQGARADLVQRETLKSSNEFEQAMRTLASAPEATPAIRDNLALAQGQWVFLKSALGSQSPTAQAASDVFSASENLLAVMETVTGQFARELGQG
ncbi:type IV pili methyl-accepting chemotaxis transducer N-terminal domain-containing protein [Pelomonas sp. UHG3]|jgi:nitrate/nitrite-specific signal transduction histidine kinase|uniref:Type IV pili methyl-accepting chemotaxis transducer N-terminal domain-containing protein n=1 Tax=Roseateles hydrophilus TaxID=2975054 RepID=A0ACC6CAN8_9BURK|nr:type IV pili methyl-accepting chemotaxis transducer N-terminal domain-containing protein [Pelomonas sp. UHG3]MCY4745379.1 type IV pili methyl-accepting chemotaxis transducer N-terminal domain-containing protein [Pelomonas sp. UHG3]